MAHPSSCVRETHLFDVVHALHRLMRFPTPACQLAIDFKHYSASASSWSSEACRALDVGHSTHARDHPLTRDQSQRLATKRRPESARASHPNLTETAPLLRVWQALLAPTQSNPSDRRIKEKRRIRRIACLMARMAVDVCHAWIRRPQEQRPPNGHGHQATPPPKEHGVNITKARNQSNRVKHHMVCRWASQIYMYTYANGILT